MAKELTARALEALLFIYGDPISIKKAAKMLDVSVEQVQSTAKELRVSLTGTARGLTLLEHNGEIQLTTQAEFAGLLKTVLKTELHEALSPASLETLSIVTYAAPIARAEIDYIRGVNSTFTIRALLVRGLITREIDPHRANTYQYRPSTQLLQHLGITALTELPDYERFHTLVSAMRAQTTAVKENEINISQAPQI